MTAVADTRRTEGAESPPRDILACPFCGGEAKDNGHPLGIMGQIYCSNDDCFGPKTTASLKEDSIKQWNNRLAATPKTGVDREVIALGDIVQVNERMPHYGEWARAELKVVGLHLAPDGTVWADVIEGDQRHRGNGIYDGETTDIDTCWLSKIHLDAPDNAGLVSGGGR